MKIPFVLLCFLYVWGLHAQTTFNPIYDSVNRVNILSATGNLDINSTSIRRGFYDRLIFGGEINDNLKNKTWDSHGATNRFGVFATAELNYMHGANPVFKNKNWAWNVVAGYYVAANMNYTKDDFRLLFYGNDSYANDTATLTGTKVRMTQFQKIGFGLNNLEKGFGFNVNFVNVQNDFNVYVQRGQWIDLGSSSVIKLNLGADAYYTKSKGSNGVGFAFDAYYNFKVPWGKSQATFRVELQNIGAAYVFNQYHYNLDSSYMYSGFTLSQLTNTNLPKTTEHWMDSLGVQKDSLGRWIALPGYFQAMKMVDYRSPKKVQSFFGIRFYPSLGTVPTGFAGVYYRFVPKWSISANGAFGGSTRIRAGLCIAYQSENWRIQLGTDDVYGAVSNSGFSTSLMGRIVWILKR